MHTFYTGTHAIKAWWRPNGTIELRICTTDAEGNHTSDFYPPRQQYYYKDRNDWLQEIVQQLWIHGADNYENLQR
jgi:hypothetical protein